MSNLLSQASLVMIPSGYKEDVVYSAIPTNGNGDLSFTRASNGTRVNSAGLVEVVAWNLAGYSEEFDNAYWVKQSATVTANSTTAPNGTLTADTFNVTATAYSSIYNNGALSLSLGIYTQGIYAKKGTKNYLYILDLTATSARAWFNLDTGVVGTVASGYTATMESVGNGWYRCSLSQNTSVTPSYFHFGASDSDNSFTPSSSGNIYIYGAQLNIGSTAKPYFPTTDRLNVPRLTYQNGGGGCPSLLLEKQSTNLALYSEQFDNANWDTSDVTVTANTTISPDGTQNADTIDAIAVGQRINQAISVSASTSYTLSFYAKKGTMTTPRYTVYDLSNNAFILTQVDYSSLINSSTWSRVTATFTTPVGCTSIGIYLINGVTTLGTIFLWGAQLEASSYATSYIPSTSASATRVADACSKTGISSLIGQSEGVVFVDFQLQTPVGNDYVIGQIYNSSTPANGIYFYLNSTSQLVGYVDNGATQANIASGVLAQGRYKAALVYKANDFAFYLNGSLIGVDVSGTVPTCNSITLIDYLNSGAYMENTQINQAILFPTRLTNAELASLTTI